MKKQDADKSELTEIAESLEDRTAVGAADDRGIVRQPTARHVDVPPSPCLATLGQHWLIDHQVQFAIVQIDLDGVPILY